jgi:Mg2+ and Co2+ transporter CorA
MNVEYPGFGSRWGVIVSTVVMAVAAFLLWITFRRRDWL